MKGPALIPRGTRPPLWREARLGLEAAALLRDPVLRGAGLADGRGRPVLLVPGFLAGDGSLAKVLARRRPELVSGIVTLGSPQTDPLAIHPLVRLQVEAVGRLGTLG